MGEDAVELARALKENLQGFFVIREGEP